MPTFGTPADEAEGTTLRDYRQVADAVASDIAEGRLKPGDRLPPQREFARRQGLANSTASRVYQELSRRGLTAGQVGRGTFVNDTRQPSAPSLSEPTNQRIDLELNYPTAPEQAGLLAPALERLTHPDRLASALRPAQVVGTEPERDTAADLLERGGWRPDPAHILFAGNGRQAITAALTALVPRGARLGVEKLTYPVLRAIASRLDITVVPLAMDEDGLIPDAVASAHRSAPLHAVYVQPTLHNPLSITMTERRKSELAKVLRELNVTAIEDTIWSFLYDELPPLAAFAPEHTVVIDSLSKRVAPGLSVGYVVAPGPLTAPVAVALRTAGSMPQRFALEAATQWQTDNVLHSLVQAKKRAAEQRQDIARQHLGDFTLRSDPRSYYCWWELPSAWRADMFVAAAARQGIAVTPAASFDTGRQLPPNAIRLGLATPDLDTLSYGLSTLAGLARSAPADLLAE